jgi:hypothetical protein
MSLEAQSTEGTKDIRINHESTKGRKGEIVGVSFAWFTRAAESTSRRLSFRLRLRLWRDKMARQAEKNLLDTDFTDYTDSRTER